MCFPHPIYQFHSSQITSTLIYLWIVWRWAEAAKLKLNQDRAHSRVPRNMQRHWCENRKLFKKPRSKTNANSQTNIRGEKQPNGNAIFRNAREMSQKREIIFNSFFFVLLFVLFRFAFSQYLLSRRLMMPHFISFHFPFISKLRIVRVEWRIQENFTAFVSIYSVFFFFWYFFCV